MSTVLIYRVPKPAQNAARAALALHKAYPLEDVYGASLATRLVEGEVDLNTITQIHRFFRVNLRHLQIEERMAKLADTSALVRSAGMHGSTSGRVWAERIYKDAVRTSDLTEDPMDAVFRAEPDDVYRMFAVGAWRWEFGLTPASAARFYEEYHRATGKVLDLSLAFGDAAPAVGNAVYRRLHGPDPFREAVRAMCKADSKECAALDLQEMKASLLQGVAFASPKPLMCAGDVKLTTKMTWPTFIAYSILAVERPDLLVPINRVSLPPPDLDAKPRNPLRYSDAINVYLTYFHPEGSRYFDPMGTEFVELPEEVFRFVERAYFGRGLATYAVQSMLMHMREWTAANGLSGSMCHAYISAWKAGNWRLILAAIPGDGAMYAPFAEFATERASDLPGPDDTVTIAKGFLAMMRPQWQYGLPPTAVGEVGHDYG